MMNGGMLVRSRYIAMLTEASGDTGIVKVLTGMRCIGKTVAMRQFAGMYTSGKKLKVLDYDFDGVAGLNMKSPAAVR